VSVTLIMS